MKKLLYTLIFVFIYSQGGCSEIPAGIKEGNMISGHVIEADSEEDIPYANVLIVETGKEQAATKMGSLNSAN